MGAYVWPVDNWQTQDGTKYTGRRLRQLVGALLTGKTPARPLGARTGVIAGTPTSTVAVSGSTCTIKPHTGVIDAQTLAIAGPYTYSNDADITRPVPAADASQIRVDLVAVQVSDPTEGDGTAAPGVDVVYVTGTPGAGAPAAPARSLVLASIGVPAQGGGAPSVTWLAPFTTAVGGVVPCKDSTQYPATPYVGMCVDDAALGAVLRYDGAQWRSTARAGMQMGVATVTGTGSLAAGGNRQVAVPLDAAIFGGNAPANVQLTCTGPYGSWFTLNVESTGSNTFTVTALNANNAAMPAGVNSIQVMWVAYR